MKKTRTLMMLLAIAALLAAPAALLAQTSGGDLNGKVVDAKKSPLPGVTITVTNKDTGSKRLDTSDATGDFHMRSLPVGTYSVVAELQGFSTVTVDDVKITVASARNLEITMSEAKVQESITVIDEAPLVQNAPAVGTVVSQQELQNLPLNGRQFANVAVLAPGTTLSYNSDPTKPGQLTIALNGGSGRNVNFLVDGGDNTDDTIGGALQNYNLEAVQEFKIQTMQYKAEYGRSSGGVLSVVTKSGGNDFSGSAYEFARRKSMNSETESEKLAGIGKQDYKRDQYGASLGGPIVKDKAHFFVTYEKTKRDTSYIINTGGVLPTLDGQSIPVPFEDELVTAKVTADPSPTQMLQVRYGYQKNADKYGQSPLAAPSSLGTVANKYSSILAGHTAQIGSDMLNEFVFQYTKFDNLISADSNDPYIYFPSGVHFGQNINTPQSTHQVKYQYKDDFSWSQTLGGRRHDFKAGFAYLNEPTLGGDFTVGTSGQYSLAEDRLGSPVTDITIYGGVSRDTTPIKGYNGYVQDDWYASDNLTINFGLRYDLWTGFDLNQTSNPIWQALSTQTTYNEGYLRDFQGGRGGKLKNDTNNWAPRFGFTWDVKGDSRHVVRGGIGRFYDFAYTNATILFPASAVQSNYGVVYNVHNDQGIRNPDGSFFQPGQPLPPNQLPGADIPPPNEVASPTLATPYSDQLSLGYSLQVTNWLGLSFDAVAARYRDIPFRFRANSFLDANGNPMDHARFPQFGNFRMWYGGGEANYKGVNIGFRIRQPKFELQGFYTLSKADGNVLLGADEFRISGGDAQADGGGGRRDVSIDSRNPLCSACEGPLYTDATHRVTFGGVYRAPWDINISGMFRYHSGRPYTEYNLAGVDLNGDRWIQDLQPGVSHVNSKRGASFSQLDLRVSKDFIFAGHYGVEILVEGFNIFNEKNPTLYNRFGQANAYAGDPGQGEQRLFQLGARFHF
ncbi:MAG: TonB-dependent receptor [Acidobacteriota bacterium]